MSLADIVSISITANTVVPSRVGFGTPLILSYHTRFIERARSYSSLAGMVADGFATTDAAYKMAAKIFAQNPKVKQVVVGRCASAQTQVVNCTPIVEHSRNYSVTINGVEYTYAADSATSAQEIVEGMVAAINAGSQPVTATEDNIKLILTADVAGVSFELDVERAEWTRADATLDPGIVADITAIQLVNDDWYTVHPTHQSTAAVVALALHIETLKKLMITESGDDEILAGTGVGATLKAAAYARTAVMYHRLPHEFPGAAWAGKLLPKDPGSATWKFKTLAGITVDDGFTVTQRNNMRADNVNFYEATSGVNITEEGKSASGEFIDITQGVDWLAQRMQERIFAKLANADKIPFTDGGIAIVENEVRGQLAEGVTRGFLTDPISVTVPLAADVDAADKADRLLPDIEFSAPLAGAIHAADVSGNVTL